MSSQISHKIFGRVSSADKRAETTNSVKNTKEKTQINKQCFIVKFRSLKTQIMLHTAFKRLLMQNVRYELLLGCRGIAVNDDFEILCRCLDVNRDARGSAVGEFFINERLVDFLTIRVCADGLLGTANINPV